MKVWEATIKVLRRTGNPAVMTGDHGLGHLIATELGWEHDGPATPDRVIAALHRTPGRLVKRRTLGKGNRLCIRFMLPEVAAGEREAKWTARATEAMRAGNAAEADKCTKKARFWSNYASEIAKN